MLREANKKEPIGTKDSQKGKNNSEQPRVFNAKINPKQEGYWNVINVIYHISMQHLCGNL